MTMRQRHSDLVREDVLRNRGYTDGEVMAMPTFIDMQVKPDSPPILRRFADPAHAHYALGAMSKRGYIIREHNIPEVI
jgi:hypothetical protein